MQVKRNRLEFSSRSDPQFSHASSKNLTIAVYECKHFKIHHDLASEKGILHVHWNENRTKKAVFLFS